MEPRQQLEKWQEQVAEADEDAAADMDVEKRLLKHGLEALDKIDSLRADRERLEWLMRNVSGAEFRRLGVTYGGNCGRDRIDAAMKTPNAEVTGA